MPQPQQSLRGSSLLAVELPKVLRAGRLPADDVAVQTLWAGLVRIDGDYTVWETAEEQLSDRELARKFARIARLSDKFLRLLADDPQRQIEAALGGKWPMRGRAVDFFPLRETLVTVSEIAALHALAYAKGDRRKSPRRTEPENWLFRQLDDLAIEIKASRPNIAAPLYRYMIGCAEWLGVDLRHVTDFVKRVGRLKL